MRHLCEESSPRCVCPEHGPRWYWPKADEHACVDPICALKFEERFEDIWAQMLAERTRQ